MRILHVIGSLNPVNGGPPKVSLDLACTLSRLGHQAEMATLDGPDQLAAYVKHAPIPIHSLGPSHAKYRFNARAVSWLTTNADRFDAVITHGIWQYQSFATWIASRRTGFRYFVFVHGALDPWFKRQYPLKHIKKWMYWPWAEYRVLRDAEGVLFTSEEEKVLAARSFWLYRTKGVVLNYGVRVPSDESARQREVFYTAFPGLRGKQLVLFLGRIHQKKGCDMLIDAFAQVVQENPDLHLVMAGPDQDGWAEHLKQRVRKLGIAASTTWTGMLGGDCKWGVLYAADVFILPSHSENFGAAVAEALACGVPVLISDKVNIWREIQQDHAGIVAPDSVEGTVGLLRQWISSPATAKDMMRQNARASFLKRFRIEATAAKLVEVMQK